MILKSHQESSTPIYHMLEAQAWQAEPDKPYAAPSLQTEGFIHCSGDRPTLMAVANRFYRDHPGNWIVLVIDPQRLSAPLQWDQVEDGTFPHLYGPLNRDAVVGIVPLPRADDGSFLPPSLWSFEDPETL